MNAAQFHQQILRPALAHAAAHIDIPPSPEAERMLLAIAGQESAWRHRYQVLASGNKGPARGFWQFERGGGVAGVMGHPSTAARARRLVEACGYPFADRALWEALEHDDTLACGFARLLLWTHPGPLPSAPAEGWHQYLALWRPGKPHPELWPNAWAAAAAAVSAAPAPAAPPVPAPEPEPEPEPQLDPARDFAALLAAEAAQATGAGQPKRPWQSRTIVFVAVSALAKALALVPGLAGLEVDVPALTEIALLGLSFAADAGAVWGRNKATRPIAWR